LSEHNNQGALGIVINRMIPSLKAESIFKELKLEYKPESADAPIFIGGPVHENEIFILHGSPFSWEGSVKITANLGMSNTMDLIRAIAKGEGPDSYLIALGCAGWGPGQLESELAQNAWLNCPAKHEILFDFGVDDRWAAAVKTLGIDPVLLSDTAGHA